MSSNYVSVQNFDEIHLLASDSAKKWCQIFLHNVVKDSILSSFSFGKDADLSKRPDYRLVVHDEP